MTIKAFTDNPQQLIDAITKAIKNEEVRTWEVKTSGEGLTLYNHTPEQWSDKALINPSAQKGFALFGVTWWSRTGQPSEDIKGYILGRFTEPLLVHFRHYFTKLETTP